MTIDNVESYRLVKGAEGRRPGLGTSIRATSPGGNLVSSWCTTAAKP